MAAFYNLDFAHVVRIKRAFSCHYEVVIYRNNMFDYPSWNPSIHCAGGLNIQVFATARVSMIQIRDSCLRLTICYVTRENSRDRKYVSLPADVKPKRASLPVTITRAKSSETNKSVQPSTSTSQRMFSIPDVHHGWRKSQKIRTLKCQKLRFLALYAIKPSTDHSVPKVSPVSSVKYFFINAIDGTNVQT